LRNGTTKGRSGKLVASCSRLWNSSAHSCEFCEQQQQRASTDRSPCQMEPLAVTNRCNRRHLTLPRTSPPDLSPPLSSPLRHSPRVHLPTGRQTDGAAAELRTTKWASRLARLSSIVSTGKKKHMRRRVRRRRHSAKPTHTDRLTNG